MMGKPPVPAPGKPPAPPPPGLTKPPIIAPAAGAKPPTAAPAPEAGSPAKAAKGAAPGKPAKAGRRPPLKIILAAAAAVVVLGAGGFFAWPYVFPPPPPPPPPAPVKPVVAVKAPAPAPTAVVAANPGSAAASPTAPAPATATTSPSANALQAVQSLTGKNFQAVANAGSALTREQAQVDSVLDGRDLPDAHAPAPPTGPAVTVPPPPAAPTVVPASVAFRAWVDGVKINAVNVSPTLTIAIINGHPAKPGDMVDASQGIVFDHVDVKNQSIVFRDRTGAMSPAKY
jgi:hypothetical protein